MKALLVLAVAVASLASPLEAAVDPTRAARQTQQQGPREGPGRGSTPSQKDRRQWRWVQNSSRGPRRVPTVKFAIPSEKFNAFIKSIVSDGSTPINDPPSGSKASGKQKEDSSCESDEGSSGEEYGYGPSNGPDTWPNNFPTCGGDRQSPININLKVAKSPPSGVEDALFMKYYDAPPSQLKVVNTGHSIKLTGNWSTKRRPRISGFVLHEEYVLADLHFHWGPDDDEGSEHLIQGNCYPLEMHLVHYKMSYGSLANAVTKEDGLAVIGYVFKIHKHKNPALQKIIDVSKKVINPESPGVKIAPFKLDKLAPPFTRNYASYLGSLTTPPCSEIVTWIVNLEPQYVSSDQLAKLRKLRNADGTKLVSNFRPVQPRNGRKIKYVS